MLRMIGARLVDAVPTVVLVLTLVFVSLRLLPGDPALVVLGEYATQEQLALFRAQMGLDQPLVWQWLGFLRDMVTLDFGASMITSQPVIELIGENLPFTIELTLVATGMGLIVGIPMGVMAAVNRGRWPDSGVRVFSLIGYAIPDFYLGALLLIVASAFVRVEPIPRLLFGARLDHQIRNTDAKPQDRITTFWLVAGYRIALPIETFLAVDRAIPTARAASEVPGSDAWQLRVIGRVVF